MLGRLARYLRFVGCDTVYARGMEDDEILRVARLEGRVVVTRDRALAGRCPESLLLTSPRIADQWQAVRSAFPEVPEEPCFERCSECNGPLAEVPPQERALIAQTGVPWDRVARGLVLYRCHACGHVYWDGSHTASIRARLRGWSATEGG